MFLPKVMVEVIIRIFLMFTIIMHRIFPCIQYHFVLEQKQVILQHILLHSWSDKTFNLFHFLDAFIAQFLSRLEK